jgi:hypothetical protein
MDSVVKMKSLPFDATQLDIIQFFEAYKLKPNGVQLVVRSDNKPTGEVCTSQACGGCSSLLQLQQRIGNHSSNTVVHAASAIQQQQGVKQRQPAAKSSVHVLCWTALMCGV